jgi:dimethylhistidine N-methyltransferase
MNTQTFNENRQEILTGLLQSQKSIPPKFLYDERGSELFEQICELEEYYLVRAEREILSKHAAEMARLIGENATLIEPGCGNCAKVQSLLQVLQTPKAYVALDISEDFLIKTTQKLQEKFPNVPVYPVVADYTQKLVLPLELKNQNDKKVVFFPGSTIGNLHPSEAKTLLKQIGSLVQPDGGLLIGVDRKKEVGILERAYDDPQGVTAEFNFNLLDRLNREFSASFDRKNFTYRARYNSAAGRVEMFLVSQIPHSVHFGEQMIHLDKMEMIHTEDSYKYGIDEFIALGESAGFDVKKSWTDENDLFGVYYFERSISAG